MRARTRDESLRCRRRFPPAPCRGQAQGRSSGCRARLRSVVARTAVDRAGPGLVDVVVAGTTEHGRSGRQRHADPIVARTTEAQDPTHHLRRRLRENPRRQRSRPYPHPRSQTHRMQCSAGARSSLASSRAIGSRHLLLQLMAAQRRWAEASAHMHRAPARARRHGHRVARRARGRSVRAAGRDQVAAPAARGQKPPAALREGKILAALEHPLVARLLDAGLTAEGHRAPNSAADSRRHGC
jgi:hypothetical protein